MAAPAAKLMVRRSILAIVAVFAVVALASCSDALFGTPRGVARVTLQPQFSPRDAAIYGSLRTFGLAATTLRVAIVRPGTTDTIAQTTVPVADGADSIVVTLEVPVVGAEGHFTALMVMTSGDIVIFEGSVAIVAKPNAAGTVAPPILVPVWVGPGKNATKIVISPRDKTIPINSVVELTAAAFDASGLPVTDPEFLSRWQWRVADTTLGAIPLAGGAFVAGAKAGTAIVTVFTPNLLRDTVRFTIVNQLPIAKVKFARQVEVVDNGASSTVPVAITDPAGNAVNNAVVTYTSRTPGIATVSGTGAITGVAKGQAIIVVRATDAGASTFKEDSLLAVIADPSGVALISSIDRFEFRTDTTIVVSIFADMRSSGKKLGSTTVDVSWNPAQLQYAGFATITGGVSATVNDLNAPTGTLALAMADVAGFGGKVELLRLTFRTSSIATTGTLTLAAREMTASSADNYLDLLATAVQVTHPLSVK